jgi:hypothetical protein
MKLHERLSAIMTSRLDMSARAILFVLATYLDSDDEERAAWPSTETIGQQAGCSRQTAGVAVEIPAPHDVCVWRLSPALLDHANREISEALRTLARCRDSGRWPGRFQGMYNLELPTWLIEDAEIPEEGIGEAE